MMLQGAGFTVVDLGVDVETKAFVDAAGENQAQLVAMSALLTTTMPVMAQCIGEFKDAGMGARLIVGGAPVNQDFAIKINADGYSSDAPGAVELAKKLQAIELRAECSLVRSSRRAVGRRSENLPSVCGGIRIRRVRPGRVGLRYRLGGCSAHASGGHETPLEAAVRSSQMGGFADGRPGSNFGKLNLQVAPARIRFSS